MNKFLKCGKIVGVHGVRGMVRVLPWADSPDFLCSFTCFYLDENGAKRLNVVSSKTHKNIALIQFDGISSVEQAETIRNRVLYIDRNDCLLEEGAYFIEDLIGLPVYDANTGELLGVFSEVSKTGSNDVWHIKRGDHEFLVPKIDDICADVDLIKGEIKIVPLKGIFSDED